MGGGRQADDQDSRVRWSEGRNRFPPVVLVAECGPFLGRRLFSPFDESRTESAAGHVLVELVKLRDA